MMIEIICDFLPKLWSIRLIGTRGPNQLGSVLTDRLLGCELPLVTLIELKLQEHALGQRRAAIATA